MRRRDHGQSMVEMALILPFLLVIVLGSIELGFYIYTYSELENATRRASERASKTPPLSKANPNNPGDKCAEFARIDAINGVYLSELEKSDITFAFPDVIEPDGTVRAGKRQVGDQVEATITYQGSFLTPISHQWFGDVLSFEFTSRRTITSINPPQGYKEDCSSL